MITRKKPEKNRLRRTMMFMNAQKPGLIKDAYIYGTDSIILDLEDAVAENQKDAARFSLYQALKNIDYGDSGEIRLEMEGDRRMRGADSGSLARGGYQTQEFEDGELVTVEDDEYEGDFDADFEGEDDDFSDGEDE